MGSATEQNQLPKYSRGAVALWLALAIDVDIAAAIYRYILAILSSHAGWALCHFDGFCTLQIGAQEAQFGRSHSLANRETYRDVTQPGRIVRFLRTTAIGGALFLLPLIVVGVLIGQVVPIVLSIAEALSKILPDAVKTVGGVTLLILLAIGVLLLLCFGAGVLARVSLSRSLSAAFEKKLVLLFPRYAILKDQMADSIGGDHARPQMKPVLVQCDGVKRIAFETERCTDLGIVTVYLPGSPDPWAGHVASFPVDQVEPLNAEFGEVTAVCEQLGRGTARLLTKSTGN